VTRKKHYRGKRKEFIKANHHIRYPKVRVLTEKGDTIGIMSSAEALKKAQEAENDLVLVTDQAKPPVVKIIELSKYKYQLQQKQSANRKSARTQELKELRFSPFMAEGDFESRMKRVVEFLEDGDKVRLSLLFKGRQITKKEFGFELFDKIIERTKEIAIVEMEPKMMGRKLIAQLSPSGNKTNEKD
jgi:translation initiation factor IF-3